MSSMTMHFEMFLADNVKFGSLDQVLGFIDNVCKEARNRKFNDLELLNHIPSKEECFAKIVLDTGYRWVPNEKELDIIWHVIDNLSREDITRIYYKNNLYEFCLNTNILNLLTTMVKKLERPYYTSVKVPPEIADDLNYFKDLCMEYVYYRYMFIDRIDRCDNMVKKVTIVSDTDSTIISLDAWYRFLVSNLNEQELRIANYCPDPVLFTSRDENGNITDSDWIKAVTFEPKKLDYNFQTDEIVEMEHMSNPDILTPNDNVRYSIISIISYVLDHTVNDYMLKMCEDNFSVMEGYHKPSECKIYSKNEFLFRRLMIVAHSKKHYASLIEVQEGNIVPPESQLDVKGIEILHKSSTADSTKKALKKILLEDILKAPAIDQLRFIKDIAIFEHQIVDSIRNGNKEYFKPAKVKSINSYDDPMKIQGVKASIAWNMLKPEELPGLNLEERNPIDIVKVNINRANAEDIKDTYPDIYNNIINALDDDTFKTYAKNPKTGVKDKLISNSIEAVALPIDVELPDWLATYIDYNSIVGDNLNGFPYESVGIQRLENNKIDYSNIVQL